MVGSNLLIRSASSPDKIIAAELILSTMGSTGDGLFGFGDHQRAVQAIGSFFIRSGNRFSYDLSSLAEIDNKVAGALLAYPGNQSNILDFGLAGPIFREYGLKNSARFLGFMLRYVSSYKENEPDEFYIAHLATLAPFRNKGVGTALLIHAEKLAREAGFRKCSLMVDIDNDVARNLYSKSGYQVVRMVMTPKMKARFQVRGFEHRVKILSL
jgi:ribosomal protein S18 acetylase RimI-like enzyme